MKKTLRQLEEKDNLETFTEGNLPDYVMEFIPKKYRKDITGILCDIMDGELGEVWLTEDNPPYDLSATYFTIDCYNKGHSRSKAYRDIIKRMMPVD